MRIRLNDFGQASLPALSLLLAAFGGDSHAHAQNQLPYRPTVSVAGASYSGTLCEQGSLEVSGSDGVDVSTSTALDAITEREGSMLEGSCDLTVDLSVPAGLSVGNATLCYNYAVETDFERSSTPAPGELSLTYGFVGGELRTVNVSEVSSFEGPCIRLQDLWTACEAPGAQLALHFSARAPAGTYVAWQGFGVSFPREVNDWRTCSGEPVDIGQSELYQDCSAATGRPCKDGLVCEQRSDELGTLAHVCRVPGQPLLPEGELCEDTAQCADGLFCGGTEFGAPVDTAVCLGADAHSL